MCQRGKGLLGKLERGEGKGEGGREREDQLWSCSSRATPLGQLGQHSRVKAAGARGAQEARCQARTLPGNPALGLIDVEGVFRM